MLVGEAAAKELSLYLAALYDEAFVVGRLSPSSVEEFEDLPMPIRCH